MDLCLMGALNAGAKSSKQSAKNSDVEIFFKCPRKI